MNKSLQTILLSLSLASFGALAACSAHESHDDLNRTTTTTTTERASLDPTYPAQNTTVVKETTHEVDRQPVEHEHHGVFHILADVIALPFRAVGALFTAIF